MEEKALQYRDIVRRRRPLEYFDCALEAKCTRSALTNPVCHFLARAPEGSLGSGRFRGPRKYLELLGRTALTLTPFAINYFPEMLPGCRSSATPGGTYVRRIREATREEHSATN